MISRDRARRHREQQVAMAVLSSSAEPCLMTRLMGVLTRSRVCVLSPEIGHNVLTSPHPGLRPPMVIEKHDVAAIGNHRRRYRLEHEDRGNPPDSSAFGSKSRGSHPLDQA